MEENISLFEELKKLDDCDVMDGIVAELKKLRKEREANRDKYECVLHDMNMLVTFYNDRPTCSFVDYVCMDVYDPDAVYDMTAEDGGDMFSIPVGRRIDPDEVLDLKNEDEFYKDLDREFVAERIQAVFRGYMARRHVAWVQRMLNTVD